jgi:hypothetical protein
MVLGGIGHVVVRGTKPVPSKDFEAMNVEPEVTDHWMDQWNDRQARPMPEPGSRPTSELSQIPAAPAAYFLTY